MCSIIDLVERRRTIQQVRKGKGSNLSREYYFLQSVHGTTHEYNGKNHKWKKIIICQFGDMTSAGRVLGHAFGRILTSGHSQDQINLYFQAH